MQSIVQPSQRVGHLGMPPVLTAKLSAGALRSILKQTTYAVPPVAETIIPHAPHRGVQHGSPSLYTLLQVRAGRERRGRSLEREWRHRAVETHQPEQTPTVQPHVHDRHRGALPSRTPHEHRHGTHLETPQIRDQRVAHHAFVQYGYPVQWQSGSGAHPAGRAPTITVYASPPQVSPNVIIVPPPKHRRRHLDPPRAHHRSVHHGRNGLHAPHTRRAHGHRSQSHRRLANHDSPHADHMHQGPIIFAGCGHAVQAAPMSMVSGH